MKKATIYSVCECQARLFAELDEQKAIIRGWATEPNRRKRTLRAPAHSILPERSRFEVAWLCPVCTRNTLRVFENSGLAFVEDTSSAPGAAPSVSAKI